MKKKTTTFLFHALLAVTVTLVLVSVADGWAESGSQSPQSADSVDAAWQKFKDAVLKGDKERVVRLSRFPISRSYGMSSIRNKAQLKRHFRDLFFNETNAAQCFPKAKPVVDRERPNEFSVSCPFARDGGNEEPFVYSFALTRAGWKFIGLDNINE